MQVETETKPKKKWLIIVLILLIVAIVTTNILVVQKQNKGKAVDLEFVSVQERKFSQTKLISGIVVEGKTDSYHVDSTMGEINEVFVEEGQKIGRNQKLFSYHNAELSYQLKQLDIDQNIANIRYDQGKKTIDMLRKQLSDVKSDREKAEDPVQEDQLDQTKQDLEQQLQDAEAQLKTTVLEMEKSNLQEEELKERKNDLIVYSRNAGVVKKIDSDEALSEQNAPFIQVGSQAPYHIEGQITELQKAQILPKQAVTITSKALPNQSWKGKIKEVGASPLSTEETAGQMVDSNPSVSYYHFVASLDSQKGLSPGFHVSLEVNLPSIKKLAVPSESVIEEAKESYIYLLKNNTVHKQNVITGIGDGQWTEIIEGVSKGDKIVAHPTATVSEGMEVNVE